MVTAPLLSDVIAVADRLWDPAWAESWDAVGLVCGDPAAPVHRIHLAVDPTAATVAEALGAGADLLLTHHPLLLRGVHGVPASTPKGRLVHDLIRGGAALFAAHTNADVAAPGVSDALADVLGVGNTVPLRRSSEDDLDVLVTFVPEPEADRVRGALADAGAGSIGDYSRSAFITGGIGTFLPGAGANPAIGVPGRVEAVSEVRIEVVLQRSIRPAVIAALRGSHPYEEQPIHLFEAVSTADNRGIGRVGELAEETTLRDFIAHAAAVLPSVAGGLRATGDPERRLRTVAVSGGAGDSYLGDAARAGADVYLTSDLRHHPASDTVESGGLALIDAPHFATEWPWLGQAARQLRSALGDTVELHVSGIVTDPWTQHAPSARSVSAPQRRSSRADGERRSQRPATSS